MPPAQGPVLVLFEDVHWIDPTSLELVDAALAQIGRAPVLMLLTSRPEGQPGLAGHPHLTRLTLSRLGRDHAETIVTQLAGKPLPGVVLARIVEQTDGVPLFIEELTRMVLGSGLLQQTDTAYIFDGPLPKLAIPTSLHDSLMARLDRLQPMKEVAQTAACIGREFNHEHSMRLALALDLRRIWTDVLQEPLPTDLRRLIDRLEQVTGGRSGAGPDRRV